MADTQDEPVFVVKLTGILRPEDIERYEREFKKQLPGRVIVTDNRVDDIYRMTCAQPRNAMVTVRNKQVPAKVWPVVMSSDELLVEWEDGTLGVAKLWDIRMMK